MSNTVIPPLNATSAQSAPPQTAHRHWWLLLGGLVAGGLLLHSLWPPLARMATRWSQEAEYSHGWLVPLFAAYLLWVRRGRLECDRLAPSWWGVGLLVVGLGLRFVAIRYYLEWIESVSIVPTLLGLVWAMGGLAALRWAWPAILFLVFMLPLPFSLEVALRQPLRSVGTTASTYLMQTIGLPAVAEGNVIVVSGTGNRGDEYIGVADACSGLRMLMTFVALSTAVAILGTQPAWRRIVVVLAAAPIAIVSNVVRITLTGVLHALHYGAWADIVFHDLAGWLMIPLALAQLWLLQWCLARLFVDVEERPLGAVPGVGVERSIRPKSGESPGRAGGGA